MSHLPTWTTTLFTSLFHGIVDQPLDSFSDIVEDIIESSNSGTIDVELLNRCSFTYKSLIVAKSVGDLVPIIDGIHSRLSSMAFGDWEMIPCGCGHISIMIAISRTADGYSFTLTNTDQDNGVMAYHPCNLDHHPKIKFGTSLTWDGIGPSLLMNPGPWVCLFMMMICSPGEQDNITLLYEGIIPQLVGYDNVSKAIYYRRASGLCIKAALEHMIIRSGGDRTECKKTFRRCRVALLEKSAKELTDNSLVLSSKDKCNLRLACRWMSSARPKIVMTIESHLKRISDRQTIIKPIPSALENGIRYNPLTNLFTTGINLDQENISGLAIGQPLLLAEIIADYDVDPILSAPCADLSQLSALVSSYRSLIQSIVSDRTRIDCPTASFIVALYRHMILRHIPLLSPSESWRSSIISVNPIDDLQTATTYYMSSFALSTYDNNDSTHIVTLTCLIAILNQIVDDPVHIPAGMVTSDQMIIPDHAVYQRWRQSLEIISNPNCELHPRWDQEGIGVETKTLPSSSWSLPFDFVTAVVLLIRSDLHSHRDPIYAQYPSWRLLSLNISWRLSGDYQYPIFRDPNLAHINVGFHHVSTPSLSSLSLPILVDWLSTQSTPVSVFTTISHCDLLWRSAFHVNSRISYHLHRVLPTILIMINSYLSVIGSVPPSHPCSIAHDSVLQSLVYISRLLSSLQTYSSSLPSSDLVLSMTTLRELSNNHLITNLNSGHHHHLISSSVLSYIIIQTKPTNPVQLIGSVSAIVYADQLHSHSNYIYDALYYILSITQINALVKSKPRSRFDSILDGIVHMSFYESSDDALSLVKNQRAKQSREKGEDELSTSSRWIKVDGKPDYVYQFSDRHIKVLVNMRLGLVWMPRSRLILLPTDIACHPDLVQLISSERDRKFGIVLSNGRDIRLYRSSIFINQISSTGKGKSNVSDEEYVNAYVDKRYNGGDALDDDEQHWVTPILQRIFRSELGEHWAQILGSTTKIKLPTPPSSLSVKQHDRHIRLLVEGLGASSLPSSIPYRVAEIIIDRSTQTLVASYYLYRSGPYLLFHPVNSLPHRSYMSSSPLSWIYRSSTVIHRPLQEIRISRMRSDGLTDILYSHRMMIGALPWSLRHEYHDWWRSDPYPFDEQQSIRITTSNLHRSSSLLLYITYSSNDCIGHLYKVDHLSLSPAGPTEAHHPDILYQLSPSSLSLWVSTLDLNGCIPTRRIRQAQKKAGLLPSSLSGYETGDSNLSDRRRYCRLSCVYGECVEYHEIRSCHNLVDGETNLYLIWTCPQPNHASNDDWTDIVSIQFPSLDTNLIYRNGKLYCGHHKTLSLSPMLYREQYGPHLLLTDFTPSNVLGRNMDPPIIHRPTHILLPLFGKNQVICLSLPLSTADHPFPLPQDTISNISLIISLISSFHYTLALKHICQLSSSHQDTVGGDAFIPISPSSASSAMPSGDPDLVAVRLHLPFSEVPWDIHHEYEVYLNELNRISPSLLLSIDQELSIAQSSPYTSAGNRISYLHQYLLGNADTHPVACRLRYPVMHAKDSMVSESDHDLSQSIDISLGQELPVYRRPNPFTSPEYEGSPLSCAYYGDDAVHLMQCLWEEPPNNLNMLMLLYDIAYGSIIIDIHHQGINIGPALAYCLSSIKLQTKYRQWIRAVRPDRYPSILPYIQILSSHSVSEQRTQAIRLLLKSLSHNYISCSSNNYSPRGYDQLVSISRSTIQQPVQNVSRQGDDLISISKSLTLSEELKEPDLEQLIYDPMAAVISKLNTVKLDLSMSILALISINELEEEDRINQVVYDDDNGESVNKGLDMDGGTLRKTVTNGNVLEIIRKDVVDVLLANAAIRAKLSTQDTSFSLLVDCRDAIALRAVKLIDRYLCSAEYNSNDNNLARLESIMQLCTDLLPIICVSRPNISSWSPSHAISRRLLLSEYNLGSDYIQYLSSIVTPNSDNQYHHDVFIQVGTAASQSCLPKLLVASSSHLVSLLLPGILLVHSSRLHMPRLIFTGVFTMGSTDDIPDANRHLSQNHCVITTSSLLSIGLSSGELHLPSQTNVVIEDYDAVVYEEYIPVSCCTRPSSSSYHRLSQWNISLIRHLVQPILSYSRKSRSSSAVAKPSLSSILHQLISHGISKLSIFTSPAVSHPEKGPEQLILDNDTFYHDSIRPYLVEHLLEMHANEITANCTDMDKNMMRYILNRDDIADERLDNPRLLFLHDIVHHHLPKCWHMRYDHDYILGPTKPHFFLSSSPIPSAIAIPCFWPTSALDSADLMFSSPEVTVILTLFSYHYLGYDGQQDINQVLLLSSCHIPMQISAIAPDITTLLSSCHNAITESAGATYRNADIYRIHYTSGITRNNISSYIERVDMRRDHCLSSIFSGPLSHRNRTGCQQVVVDISKQRSEITVNRFREYVLEYNHQSNSRRISDIGYNDAVSGKLLRERMFPFSASVSCSCSPQYYDILSSHIPDLVYINNIGAIDILLTNTDDTVGVTVVLDIRSSLSDLERIVDRLSEHSAAHIYVTLSSSDMEHITHHLLPASVRDKSVTAGNYRISAAELTEYMEWRSSHQPALPIVMYKAPEPILVPGISSSDRSQQLPNLYISELSAESKSDPVPLISHYPLSRISIYGHGYPWATPQLSISTSLLSNPTFNMDRVHVVPGIDLILHMEQQMIAISLEEATSISTSSHSSAWTIRSITGFVIDQSLISPCSSNTDYHDAMAIYRLLDGRLPAGPIPSLTQSNLIDFSQFLDSCERVRAIGYSAITWRKGQDCLDEYNKAKHLTAWAWEKAQKSHGEANGSLPENMYDAILMIFEETRWGVSPSDVIVLASHYDERSLGNMMAVVRGHNQKWLKKEKMWVEARDAELREQQFYERTRAENERIQAEIAAEHGAIHNLMKEVKYQEMVARNRKREMDMLQLEESKAEWKLWAHENRLSPKMLSQPYHLERKTETDRPVGDHDISQVDNSIPDPDWVANISDRHTKYIQTIGQSYEELIRAEAEETDKYEVIVASWISSIEMAWIDKEEKNLDRLIAEARSSLRTSEGAWDGEDKESIVEEIERRAEAAFQQNIVKPPSSSGSEKASICLDQLLNQALSDDKLLRQSLRNGKKRELRLRISLLTGQEIDADHNCDSRSCCDMLSSCDISRLDNNSVREIYDIIQSERELEKADELAMVADLNISQQLSLYHHDINRVIQVRDKLSALMEALQNAKTSVMQWNNANDDETESGKGAEPDLHGIIRLSEYNSRTRSLQGRHDAASREASAGDQRASPSITRDILEPMYYTSYIALPSPKHDIPATNNNGDGMSTTLWPFSQATPVQKRKRNGRRRQRIKH